MLKALELIAFKSFADKTRFEFPSGITAVVGPNGSGKSNVVDAIKWVLGEQSVKSLRGKEMSDVIFKGAGPGGRKPANAAEVTLSLDNSDRKIPFGVDEIHITRRAYASGEGEYLLNGQACRLKDIRDLFRGTGMSGDGYSVIEQGRVDRLLQASRKERRGIFEEAAGISRFKAKKVESLRRLERVDQNILRLRDLIEEIEGRLRNVQGQARKARKYRELNDRFRAVRLDLAVRDWRTFREQITEMENAGVAAANLLVAAQKDHEVGQARLAELEHLAREADSAVRETTAKIALVREELVGLQSTLEHQRVRRSEMQDELRRRRDQMVVVSSRIHDARTQLSDLEDSLRVATTEVQDAKSRLSTLDAEWQLEWERREQLRTSVDGCRSEHRLLTREHESCVQSIQNLEATKKSITSEIDFSLERISQRMTMRNAAVAECKDQSERERQIRSDANRIGESLETAQVELDKKRLILVERQDDLGRLRGRHRGAIERAALLEDLELRREGFHLGVRAFLESLTDLFPSDTPKLRVVADLIQAPRPLASLIDLALGDTAQSLVVDNEFLRNYLQNSASRVQGRVTFFAFAEPTTHVDRRGAASGDTPGVIGRADRLVEAAPENHPLVERLLGSTWVVEQLSDALRLRPTWPGQRFVTMRGELLEADGSLVVGAGGATVGIVSRRSELRGLQADTVVYERQIRDAENELSLLKGQIADGEVSWKQFADQHRELILRSATIATQVQSLQERIEQWNLEIGVDQNAVESKRKGLAELESESESLLGKVEALARSADKRDQERLLAEKELEAVQSRLSGMESARTALREEVARSEQRLNAIEFQRSQSQSDERNRAELLGNARIGVLAAEERVTSLDLEMLRGEARAFELFSQKEKLETSGAGANAHWRELENERHTLAASLTQTLNVLRKRESERNERILALSELRRQQEASIARTVEDYALSMESLVSEHVPDESRSREEVDEEVTQLRRRLQAMGAVNLESLEELEELEGRHRQMSNQYADLQDAKGALHRMIERIDEESRQLFETTLNTIRLHFQDLYRKAFGGGMATLALEEGGDPLEAGVEILATPPGKTTFSNTLLSGGEKALTAVALLLAIFRFRPSPFCILDEVDAPFDEANIGRFMDMLKDFLATTKFVVITHSKRTMVAADTLYGVTMQESGVSKQVSIRFEDIREGTIDVGTRTVA